MNVAFIPVRGGSKAIPLKNIKLMNGKPLVYWTVRAACDCKYIDEVYVSTDSCEIREVAESFKTGSDSVLFSKLRVIGRSAESASDTASTEFAMLEFAKAREFDNIALVQATSPLLTGGDLDRGFELFLTDGTDSVLSVVPQKRFNWQIDENGYAHPSNYDVFNRPRRQKFVGYLVENGAFYITTRVHLLMTKNRLTGNIKAVEMSEDSFLEIDEPNDWLIIETLMKKRVAASSDRTIPKIKMFLTDCDGCLTDGGMYYSENGDEMKKFSTLDGMAFQLLREAGVITGIVTGEESELVKRRAKKLQMDIVKTGIRDKESCIQTISKAYGIELSEIAYVGDDVNDISVLRNVGFSACPSSAQNEVKGCVGYIADKSGGSGAIREIAELVLDAHKGRCQ